MCKSGKPGKTTAEIDTASMDSYDVGSTEIKSYLQCIVFVVYVASRTKFKKSARHRGRPVGISPFGAESVAPVPEDRRHSLNGTVSATAGGQPGQTSREIKAVGYARAEVKESFMSVWAKVNYCPLYVFPD